jgi:mRNA-degrading endonuclease YafQ of YafQ-DinJ toxin-antitoxin module
LEIRQTALFKKQIKKLHRNQKAELDSAIKKIIQNPRIGITKHDDLIDIRVYKFYMINQLQLLAYEFDENQLILLFLGTHENFYRDLKANIYN